ncbi:MAG: hypothetical protein WC082_14750 [Victivallales bacterium]
MKRVSILVMAAVLAVLGSNLMAAAEKNPFEKDVKEIKALKKQLDDLQGKENQDKAIEKLNKKYESAQASLTKKVEKINGGLQKTLDKIDKKITAIKDKGGDVTKVEEEYKKIQDKIEQIRKWSSIEEEGGSKDSDKDDKKDDKKADKEADKDDEKSDDKEDEEKTDKKSKKSKK